MADERLDRHDKIHHELFDEDTARVGGLGDIVEQHAGDAVFLTPAERSPNGADGGESDFEAEMLETDPSPQAGLDEGDVFSARDQTGPAGADLTGTVGGIARGFGTHLPQDLGAGGFQIESLPAEALRTPPRPLAEGEELDDYDDDAPDAGGVGSLEPGTHMVSIDPDAETEPTPERIPLKRPRSSAEDDALDAVRQIK